MDAFLDTPDNPGGGGKNKNNNRVSGNNGNQKGGGYEDTATFNNYRNDINSIGKYLLILNNLDHEFRGKYRDLVRQIENDKLRNNKKKKNEIIDFTKKPNFLNRSYIPLFQGVCGEKAILMWYGNLENKEGNKLYENNIHDTKVTIKDGKIQWPWDIQINEGFKGWNQYIREILPLFSLTEGKYNIETKSEVKPEPATSKSSRPDTGEADQKEEEAGDGNGNRVQAHASETPEKEDSDIHAGGAKPENGKQGENTIRRKREYNTKGIFYNINLDEENRLWKQPININGINIDPPLIKLIYLKSNIIDLSKIFYRNASIIEKNLKLYKDLNKLIKNNEKVDRQGLEEDEDYGDDNFKKMGDDSSDSATIDNLYDNKKEHIEDKGKEKESEKESETSSKIENKLYSSSELDDLQKSLEKLKLEIKQKELAIKNMNINIGRLEKLGHGEESEERQRAIKDYEYQQKKLILLNKLVKQRQDKIDFLKKILKEIENKNERELQGNYENNKIQEEISELKLKGLMKETIKNKTDRDNLLYNSLKNSELNDMEEKLREIEKKENDLKIKSIRNDRNNKSDLSDILFKSKDRTPRKKRKKKKNKTLKK
tara:strand:+ start:77 stop:1876 length:1800 start_codon:yes stop_codon:yes gene_type:complete